MKLKRVANSSQNVASASATNSSANTTSANQAKRNPRWMRDARTRSGSSAS